MYKVKIAVSRVRKFMANDPIQYKMLVEIAPHLISWIINRIIMLPKRITVTCISYFKAFKKHLSLLGKNNFVKSRNIFYTFVLLYIH